MGFGSDESENRRHQHHLRGKADSKGEGADGGNAEGVNDVVGDKWTLLIVRDLLFMGKRRYQELAESPEGIPTNILADRLKRLEKDGLVAKSPYQTNPVRYAYSLTPKGTDLKSVLISMVEWSGKHVPGARVPPAKFLKG